MAARSGQAQAVPCLPLIPAVTQGAAWVAPAPVVSGRVPAVCWLIVSFLAQGSMSRAGVLAGSSTVQYHAAVSSCECCGPHLLSCDRNVQQFMGGWEWSALKKKKVTLIRFILLFFILLLKIFKGFPPSLWKLSKPHSVCAVKLAAVRVMVSHSSWHALCSLPTGSALNNKFSLTVFFTLLLGLFFRE